MAEPGGEINGKKINGNTPIVLNLKALVVIIGLIISGGSTIFGVISSKINKTNDSINALEQTVEGYNTTVTSVQAQNVIILKHYGIDIEIDAEEVARARRDNNGRPGSLADSN